MFDWKVAILITLIYTVVDALFALYNISIQQRKAKTAATIGAVTYALYAAGTLSYISCPYYLIFLGMGSWIGTFITVTYFKK